jgi:hypothetical protein
MQENSLIYCVVDKVNFIMRLGDEEPAKFSLNMVMNIINRIKLLYSIVRIEGRIVYVYDSINHSQFICAEEPSEKFYEPLKKLGCKVPEYNFLERHDPGNDRFCNVSSHYDKSDTKIQCKCFMYKKPTNTKGSVFKSTRITMSHDLAFRLPPEC